MESQVSDSASTLFVCLSVLVLPCPCAILCPQVHALELEQELADERTRLAELRKVHYHLGGSQEGWEDTVRNTTSSTH